MQVGSKVRRHAVESKKAHPLDFSGFFEGLEQTTPILLALGQGFAVKLPLSSSFQTLCFILPLCSLVWTHFVSDDFLLCLWTIFSEDIPNLLCCDFILTVLHCLDEICPGLVWSNSTWGIRDRGRVSARKALCDQLQKSCILSQACQEYIFEF